MIAEQTFEGRRESLSQANKLSCTFWVLLEALNRHRGKGQQKARSSTCTSIRRTSYRRKAEERGHASRSIPYEPGAPMWSPDPERRALNSTGQRRTPRAGRPMPQWVLLGLVAATLLRGETAPSAAQDLPPGGRPIPELRRGADGQIDVVPSPDAAAHPRTVGRRTPPRANGPKPGSPQAGRHQQAWATAPWLVATDAPFSAICDGKSHPLSQKFATLAAAQAVYPFVTSLSQEIDFASLKLASNTAFGADGAEHGSSNPQANIPLYIPQGVCYLGNDTWTIRKASGIRIEGAAATATTLTGNGTVLAFDGLWYSQIGNLAIATQSSSAIAALDIDGNLPGHPYDTFGVQANTFPNLFVNGGGGNHAVAVCRRGGSDGQCSEMTFINPHFINASFAVYYQNGFNAIDNVFIGGDIQNYTKNGIYLVAGSLKVLGTSFESTTGYTQILNGGCDIQASAAGAGDTILAYGNRTESLCFYNGAWSQMADVRGLTQRSAVRKWTASTNFALNSTVIANYTLFRTTKPGISGASQPAWSASGRVTDGTVVWTATPYNVVSIQQGSFDVNSSYIDWSATIVQGSEPGIENCGNSPVLDVNSTQHSGTVTEGTGATGCTIKFSLMLTKPKCVVSSPTGATLISYNVSGDRLVIKNPLSAKGDNKFTWICQ
jgi:hypothetical protein